MTPLGNPQVPPGPKSEATRLCTGPRALPGAFGLVSGRVKVRP
jgi:hypothetical protein